MQVACEVCRVLMTDRSKVQMHQFKLPFSFGDEVEESQTERSKAAWIGALKATGAKMTYKTVEKEERDGN